MKLEDRKLQDVMLRGPIEAIETLRLERFQQLHKNYHHVAQNGPSALGVNAFLHGPYSHLNQSSKQAEQFDGSNPAVDAVSNHPNEQETSFDPKQWSLLHSPENLFSIDAENLELIQRLSDDSGIGEVWVGTLTEPSGIHQVAVKRYPSAFAEEELKMFRREVGVLFMAASRCHNVCKVYGTTVKGDKLCIVMRLYRESMAALLRRQPDGRLPLQQVRRYGAEICKAVAELHEQSIIVQDLKPPNILVDSFDHCVVADFGISKILQAAVGAHMPSNVQGTFNYMSPEAFDPEQFGGVTLRADSWSFACTLCI